MLARGSGHGADELGTKGSVLDCLQDRIKAIAARGYELSTYASASLRSKVN